MPDLIGLWRRFMREEHEAVPDADPEAAGGNWPDRLRGQIERKMVVVAVRDGDIVGFAGFLDAVDRDWIPRSIAYVVDFYVIPEARTLAAAKMLLDGLENRLSRDYARIWTNASVRNRRVKILLQRAGFKPLDDFRIPGLEGQAYFAKQLRDS